MSQDLIKQTYDNVMDRLENRSTTADNQMGNNLFSDLLLEKSLDIDALNSTRKENLAQQSLVKDVDKVLNKG